MMLFTKALWLEAKQNKGYGLLPIPDKRDEEISALIERWMALGQEERGKESTSITQGQHQTLLAYSERMASFAARSRDARLIILGLVALGIDGWRFDWRDNAILLSLHYDSATRSGLSPQELFSRAASVLPPMVADALDAFLERAEKDQSLDAMGYEESFDNDGFRYRRTW